MSERQAYVPPDDTVRRLHGEVGELIGLVAHLLAVVAAVIDTLDASQIPVPPIAREWRKLRY